jgi:hypothetical protein
MALARRSAGTDARLDRPARAVNWPRRSRPSGHTGAAKGPGPARSGGHPGTAKWPRRSWPSGHAGHGQSRRSCRCCGVGARLYRSYLLEEQLRLVFHEAERGRAALRARAGAAGATSSDLEPSARLRGHAPRLLRADRRDAALTAQRRARGSTQRHDPAALPPRPRLHFADALISLVILTLGGRPPARTRHRLTDRNHRRPPVGHRGSAQRRACSPVPG